MRSYRSAMVANTARTYRRLDSGDAMDSSSDGRDISESYCVRLQSVHDIGLDPDGAARAGRYATPVSGRARSRAVQDRRQLVFGRGGLQPGSQSRPELLRRDAAEWRRLDGDVYPGVSRAREAPSTACGR